MLGETFDLPVTYKGNEIRFPAVLRHTGYTHRFEVDVYGDQVVFERDEEGSYRAVAGPDADADNLDAALLQAIAEAIGEALR